MAIKKTWLANLGRLAGAVGVVLWVSTPLTYLLSGEVGSLLVGKMLGGTLLWSFYLVTHASGVGRILRARSTGHFLLTLISALLVVVAVGGLNVLAALHPFEKDLTRDKLYTFSEQTHQVLKDLDRPIVCRAFYSSTEPAFAGARDILQRYAKQSRGMLRLELIDPMGRPDLVAQYKLTDQGPRILLQADARDVRVRQPEEQELTAALIDLTTSHRKRLYFLQGHAEGDLDLGDEAEGFKLLAEALRNDGHDLERLDFRRATPAEGKGLQVPKDADLVVLLGPQQPLRAPEVAALRSYLGGGGHLLALLERGTAAELDALLGEFGIRPRGDLVIDPSELARLVGLGPASPIVSLQQGDHPLLRRGAKPLILSTVQSLELGPAAGDAAPPTALALAGEQAWGETQLDADGSVAKDANDTPPPLVVAAAAERVSGEGSPARLLVVGDADWLSNRSLRLEGNLDFLLNMVEWSTGQAAKISIRPRSRANTRLYLTDADLGRLKFFSMDLLPVLLMAFGLAVVQLRRQR